MKNRKIVAFSLLAFLALPSLFVSSAQAGTDAHFKIKSFNTVSPEINSIKGVFKSESNGYTGDPGNDLDKSVIDIEKLQAMEASGEAKKKDTSSLLELNELAFTNIPEGFEAAVNNGLIEFYPEDYCTTLEIQTEKENINTLIVVPVKNSARCNYQPSRVDNYPENIEVGTQNGYFASFATNRGYFPPFEATLSNGKLNLRLNKIFHPSELSAAEEQIVKDYMNDPANGYSDYSYQTSSLLVSIDPWNLDQVNNSPTGNPLALNGLKVRVYNEAKTSYNEVNIPLEFTNIDYN